MAERIAHDERKFVVLAIVLLAALAWGWTVRDANTAGSMGSMAMLGGTAAGGLLATAPLLLVMWFIMMVAMMLPSAAPAILLYGRIRASRGPGAGIMPSALFAAGYLLAWLAVSLFATLAQLGATRAGLLDAMAMRMTSPAVVGGVLVLAGLYQLTSLKYACLTHCRSPAAFMSSHWRSGARGAVRLGVLHGGYCIGCCWLLMALLFVGGVMNMALIVALTALVAIEKLWGQGIAMSRVIGAGLMIVGAAYLLT